MNGVLWLTEAQARTIAQHALDDAPCEACGLVGGVGIQARRVVPLPNTAADPTRSYYADPAALARTLIEFDRDGLTLLGIYHSHPAGDPRPSNADIQLAHYPDSTYLIVGLRGHEPELGAWNIRNGRVHPVTLHIGLTPPDTPEPALLSDAQRAAILMSALLAFVVMIILSLVLLPPAPPIP
jgi:proteasome lid subunit RPN8/RPN11